jgi:anti-sigma B factor antagonist
MAQTEVSMAVRIVDDHTSIIAIRGELSLFAEALLMDAYLRACATEGGAEPGAESVAKRGAQRSPMAIILDMTQMEYMNSGGIGLLVTLLVRMNRLRQHLLAFGLSEHYQQIFALTRLDEAIAVFDSEAEALAAALQAYQSQPGD